MKEKKVKKIAARLARIEKRMANDTDADYAKLKEEFDIICSELSQEDMITVNDYIYNKKLIY